VKAKNAAFAVLYGSARATLTAQRSEAVSDDDVRGLVMAGWSASHGFATLALNGSLSEQFGTDAAALAPQIASGIVTLGELVRHFE
jgi:hypothetical protein